MFSNLRKYFFSGLVVFLPIALTTYLFYLAITFADNFFKKFFDQFGFEFGDYYGLNIIIGIVIGIWIIVVIGYVTTNFFGRKIHEFFESLFLKLPFFKQVYPALKEMVIFLFTRERIASFRQVVLIEYPRKGIYSMGFLTNNTSKEVCDYAGKELTNVFVPTSPSPLTGFTVLVVKNDIIHTNISIEDAFKFIVSGGVVNPHQFIASRS